MIFCLKTLWKCLFEEEISDISTMESQQSTDERRLIIKEETKTAGDVRPLRPQILLLECMDGYSKNVFIL